MTCPKCGSPSVPAPECPYCGVVYAKFRPPSAGSPPAAASARRRTLAILVSVATIAAAGLGVALKLRSRDADLEPREGREPVTPSSPTAAAPVPGQPPAPVPDQLAAPSSTSAARNDADPGPSPLLAPEPEPVSCGLYSLAGIPGAPPRPSASATWYQGASGFQRAKAEQASSGAPLLVLFYVNWCPHCRRLIDEVLPSAEVRDLGERIVKVKVDAEGGEDDRELARQFAVTSYPTLLMMAGPERLPERIRQWSSPKAFVESCERALPNPARDHLDKGISLSRGGAVEQAATELKDAAGDARVTAVALDHLGVLALKASCFERAVAIYTRVLDIDSTYRGGRAHHLRGLARVGSGDTSRGLEDAERACQLAERINRTAP